MRSITQTWSTEHETLKLATWAVTFEKFNQLSLEGPYIYIIANISIAYTYLEEHFSQALSLSVLINI